MTVLRALCFVGLHLRRGWKFVGSSWQPNDYVYVCVECGKEMNRRKEKRMKASKYGDWETKGEEVDTTVQPVASIHHWHGDTCLCGTKSATARGRTEHIIDATLKALDAGALLRKPL